MAANENLSSSQFYSPPPRVPHGPPSPAEQEAMSKPGYGYRMKGNSLGKKRDISRNRDQLSYNAHAGRYD